MRTYHYEFMQDGEEITFTLWRQVYCRTASHDKIKKSLEAGTCEVSLDHLLPSLKSLGQTVDDLDVKELTPVAELKPPDPRDQKIQYIDGVFEG